MLSCPCNWDANRPHYLESPQPNLWQIAQDHVFFRHSVSDATRNPQHEGLQYIGRVLEPSQSNNTQTQILISGDKQKVLT
jgi:hypothetical protein